MPRPLRAAEGEQTLPGLSAGGFLRKSVDSNAVGVLFLNQLNVVVVGHATAFVCFKSGLTYCVPFMISNIGVLVASHRQASGQRRRMNH